MNKKSFALLALMSASAVNIHATNVAELKGNVPEEKVTASVAPEEQTANDEKSDDKGIGKINYEPIDLDTDNGVVSLAGSKGFKTGSGFRTPERKCQQGARCSS